MAYQNIKMGERRFSVSLFICAFVLILLSDSVFAEQRTWTTADGKHTVEAEFVRFDIPSKTVILKNKDGQEKGFKEELLCADDLDYAKKQSAQRRGGEENPFNFDNAETKDDSKLKSPNEVRTRYALLVGVDEYENITGLRFAGNDVVALTEQLKKSGFNERNVITLHDKSGSRKMLPDKKNIEREIESLADRANEDDLIFLTFSGHGVNIKGKAYLAPYEAKFPKSDEDTDSIASLIEVDWIYEKLQASAAKVKLIYLDACQEDIFKSKDGRKGLESRSFKPMEIDSPIPVSKSNKGGSIIRLFACSPGQYSQESAELKHGVYSYFLIKGLSGEADENKSGIVSFKELDKYVTYQVQKYVKENLNEEQVPGFDGRVQGDPFLAVIGVATISEDVAAAIRADFKEYQNEFQKGKGSKPYFEANHNTKFSKWKEAAEHGNADAQLLFGLCYHHGAGVAEDKTEAIKWYRKAAEQGSIDAQREMGRCFFFGDGVSKDAAEAVKWYRKAAEQGDVVAQHNLGMCYQNGNGVKNDIDEAVKWFRKAAEQGNADAQYNLGVRYMRGDGVSKDIDEAVKWYRKAAEQGNANAQCALGTCYVNGNGVSKDAAEAVKWFRKAAEQGDANAQNSLGAAYYNGNGVSKDAAEAVKWFRKAAEQGDAYAQNNLGVAYYKGEGVSKDTAEAVKWYRKAAEQGNAGAQNNLGWCYVNGEGVSKDTAEAVKWVRKAAEQGHAGAQNNLGWCYQNGEGVSKDAAEAVNWYRKAAEQGYADAQFNLGVCYGNGEGVSKDAVEAVKWYRKAAEQSHTEAIAKLQEIKSAEETIKSDSSTRSPTISNRRKR